MHDSTSYWKRYAIGLGVGGACAVFTDWGSSHSLEVLAALAAFGRLSDVASTVRILDRVDSASESAPGLEGKPRPWVLFQLGLRQVLWIALLTLALGPFAPQAVAKALVAIGIASLAISVSNYFVVVVNALHNPWSLQFAHPFDQLAPYRFQRRVEEASWHAFLMAQPIGVFIVYGLLAAEGWVAAPAYAALALGTHAMYVLAKYLYFTAPLRWVDTARRLERDALRRIPQTLEQWPVKRRSALASLGRMDREGLRECLKCNPSARAILERTRHAATSWTGLDERLAELAKRSPADVSRLFQLDQDPYARIELYSSNILRLGYGVCGSIRTERRRSWEGWREMQRAAQESAQCAMEIARVRLLAALAQAAQQSWHVPAPSRSRGR